jgi:hypothetical protein
MSVNTSQPRRRQIESSLLLLSSGWPSFFEVGFDGEGVPAVVPGRMVVSVRWASPGPNADHTG